MDNAITVKNLCKNYQDFTLHHVNFQVPQGSIMGFVGANGAGKTTTLKAILGLIHTNGGEITVLGKDPTLNRQDINSKIGVVMDNTFFYESMQPYQIEKIMKRIQPHWQSNLFYQYCEQFSLPLKKQIKEFSKGMRAKLSLATALSHQPKLLILDEATSGLDPVVRSEILDLFLEFIQDETHSILLSSHITSDLEKVADYITFIHDGKIVFTQSMTEIVTHYGILKCTKEDAAKINPDYIIGRRDTSFSTELLVNQKTKLSAYPVEKASIDEIMTFLPKEYKV